MTTPARETWRTRFPWLAVNLVTAFIAASVVRFFEPTIQKWTALAAFMPIVAGMGGNAGTQTLTVFVRALALGEIDWRTRLAADLEGDAGRPRQRRRHRRDHRTHRRLLDRSVGARRRSCSSAMCGNLVIAGVAGGLVPLLLERLGFDPAVASSIFVTTFTDTGGFFLFLGLATLAMKWVRLSRRKAVNSL